MKHGLLPTEETMVVGFTLYKMVLWRLGNRWSVQWYASLLALLHFPAMDKRTHYWCIIKRIILSYSITVLLQYSSVTCSPFQLLCFTTVFVQQCLPGFTFSLEPKTKYRSFKKKGTSCDIFIFKVWIYDLKDYFATVISRTCLLIAFSMALCIEGSQELKANNRGINPV